MKIQIPDPETPGEPYWLKAVIAEEDLPAAGGAIVATVGGKLVHVRFANKAGDESGVVLPEYGFIERGELFWIVTRGRTLAKSWMGDK